MLAFKRASASSLVVLSLFAWITSVHGQSQELYVKNLSSNALHTPLPNQTQYKYRIDKLDPNPQNNPGAKLIPGYRAANQMVLYTAASHRPSTETNQAGFEATLINGVIQSTLPGNSPIPLYNGAVLSGHGSAALWLQRFAQPGAKASYDNETQEIHIQFTPEVYLYQVDSSIAAAKKALNNNPKASQHAATLLSEAQQCRTNITQSSLPTLSNTWEKNIAKCHEKAQEAYYQTLITAPEELRGAWIRPSNQDTDPTKLNARLQEMKALGINTIFLETYYQGKTIFPSETMRAVGLSSQHAQFLNQDPLKVWLEAAHANGMNLHAWTQIFFAGNREANAETFGPILHVHPEWTNIQRGHIKDAVPVASEIEPGHYFLDPANPDVRRFLHSLLTEIVTHYNVDGINLDYIRYPASYTLQTPGYLSSTWGYTPIARKRFVSQVAEERRIATEEEKRKEAEAYEHDAIMALAAHLPAPKKSITQPKTIVSSISPKTSDDPIDLQLSNPLWLRWVTWRKEQISSFVAETSNELHQFKPHLLLSAVVFPSLDPAYSQKLQDYPRWVQSGWIQALTPIGLSTKPQIMTLQAKGIREQIQDKVPVYPGVFSLYNRETPTAMVNEIQALHEAGVSGVVFFDFSRLTPQYRNALEMGPFRK